MLKKTIYLFLLCSPLICISLDGKAQSLETCRTLKKDAHLIYYKSGIFLRIEFEKQTGPHKLVRVQFGECGLKRAYIDIDAPSQDWSGIAKLPGGSEICVHPNDRSCPPRLRFFFSHLENHVKKQTTRPIIPLIWQKKATKSFGVFLCSQKKKGIFLECLLITPSNKTFQVDMLEEGSLGTQNPNILAIPEQMRGIRAIGKKGMVFETKDQMIFKSDQPHRSFRRAKSSLCSKVPTVVQKHAKTFKLLKKNRLVSLLVLSKKTWWGRLHLLSEPRLWVLRSHCDKR